MISVTAQLAAHAEENTALFQPQQRKLQLGAEAAHLVTEDGAAAYLKLRQQSGGFTVGLRPPQLECWPFKSRRPRSILACVHRSINLIGLMKKRVDDEEGLKQKAGLRLEDGEGMMKRSKELQ